MYLYIYEHKSDIHAWKIYHIIENIDCVKYLSVSVCFLSFKDYWRLLKILLNA